MSLKNTSDIDNLYFCDDGLGLHRKTSHPNFVNHFSDDFYYDCEDEEAPFGSDEGFDTLMLLEESIRRNQDINIADFPKKLIEKEWGMKYVPADSLNEVDVKNLLELDEINVIQSDIVVCAIAFGQIKVTGELCPRLKKCALDSMQRRNLSAKLLGWGEESEIISQMIYDLSSFEE